MDNRIELKYLFPKYQNKFILQKLKCSDLNIVKKYNSRKINSIYFDTHNYHSISEHLDGLNNRYKIRLRWYGDLYKLKDSSIEFKIKKNNFTEKKRLKLELEEDIDLGNFSEKNLFEKIKKMLVKSKFVNFTKFNKISKIISYERNYYESKFENIRFTLDENLRYYIWKKNMKIKLDKIKKLNLDNLNILEVKCDFNTRILIKNIENLLNLKNVSYSKYLEYRY